MAQPRLAVAAASVVAPALPLTAGAEAPFWAADGADGTLRGEEGELQIQRSDSNLDVDLLDHFMDPVLPWQNLSPPRLLSPIPKEK